MTKEEFIADYKKSLDWRWQQEFEDIIDSTWQARDAEIELLKAINDHINYQLKKVTEQAIEQKQRIKELEKRLDSYDQIE